MGKATYDLFQPCVRIFYHIVTRVYPFSDQTTTTSQYSKRPSYEKKSHQCSLLITTINRDFCWFLFFVGIEKNTLIWHKVYVLRTSYVEKCRSDYWCMTWVENPSSASCGIFVSIVVSQVHQKQNRRCLIHREFNYLCIRHLQFLLNWYISTTIGTTSPQLASCIDSILWTCSTNNDMSSSSESEPWRRNAYRI